MASGKYVFGNTPTTNKESQNSLKDSYAASKGVVYGNSQVKNNQTGGGYVYGNSLNQNKGKETTRKKSFYETAMEQFNTTAEYLNSGKTDRATTDNLLQQAYATRDAAVNRSGMNSQWRDMADSYSKLVPALEQMRGANLADEKAAASARNQEIDAELKEKQNAYSKALSTTKFDRVSGQDKYVGENPDKILKEINALKEEKKVNDEIINTYATSEEREKILGENNWMSFFRGSNVAKGAEHGEENYFDPVTGQWVASGTDADALKSYQGLQRLHEMDVNELYNGDYAYGGEKLNRAISGALNQTAGGIAGAVETIADYGAQERQKLIDQGGETYYDEFLGEDVSLNNARQLQAEAEKYQAVAERAQGIYNTMDEQSKSDIAAAKAGLDKFGQFAVDLGVNAVQMGTDMLLGAGTTSLLPMAIRVFGQEAQAAKAQGYDVYKQLGYGVTKAGIEMLTEKIFGMFDKIGYGKGFASGGWEQKLIEKLSSNDVGRTAARFLISAVEEGGEEALSDIFGVLADVIYKDESLREAWQNNTENILYDFLVGATMGAIGTGAGVVTGQNAALNAEIDQNAFKNTLPNLNNEEAKLNKSESKMRDLFNRSRDALAAIESGKVVPDSAQLSRPELIRAVDAGIVTPEEASSIMKAQANQSASNQTDESAGEPTETKTGNEKKTRGDRRRDKLRAEAEARAEKEGFLDENTETLFDYNEAPQNLQNKASQTQDVEKGTQTPAKQETAVDNGSRELNSEANNRAREEEYTKEREYYNSNYPDMSNLSTDELAKKTEEGAKRSAVKNSIILGTGKNSPGWYYYANTLADYVAMQQISERQYYDTLRTMTSDKWAVEHAEDVFKNHLGRDIDLNNLSDEVDRPFQMETLAEEELRKKGLTQSTEKAKRGTIETQTDKGGVENGTSDQENGEADVSRGERDSGRDFVLLDEESKDGWSLEEKIKRRWGEKNTTRKAQSPEEIDAESAIHKIAGDDVDVLFVFPGDDIGEDAWLGAALMDGNGKQHVIIRGDHPYGKIGRYATAIHESIHAKFHKVFPAGKGRIYSTLGSFVENYPQHKDSVKDILRSLANSYYEDSVSKFGLPVLNRNSLSYNNDLLNLLKTNDHFADKIANEFFAYLASGTLKAGAPEGVDMDAFQSDVQDFLTQNEIIDAGSFVGAPKSTDVSNAINEKATAIGKTKAAAEKLKSRSKQKTSEVADAEAPEQIQSRDNSTLVQAPGKTASNKDALRDKTQTKGAIKKQKATAEETAEEFGVGAGKHLKKTQEQVDQAARAMRDRGDQAEYTRLINKEGAWAVEEIAEAQMIIVDMTNQLMRDMTNRQMNDGEISNRQKEINALIQRHSSELSAHGQALRQRYKIKLSDRIRLRAARSFSNWSPDGKTWHGYPSSKQYRIVDNMLTKAEKCEANNDVDGLIELCKQVSRVRGNDTLLGKFGLWMEDTVLNNLKGANWTAEQVAPIVYGNINRICDDYNKVDALNMARQIRITNALSNVSTGVNNFLNNDATFVFNALGHNVGYYMDKALSKIGKSIGSASGKTAIAKDEFIKSRNFRSEALAYQLAVLESYYGIEAENGRVDIKNAAKLNPNAGWFERGVARYQFFVNAMVLAPDALAKQRAKDSLEAGINKAFEGQEGVQAELNKAELLRDTQKEQQRRTYQDDNELTKIAESIRDGLDKISQKMSFGQLKAGSFEMMFVKVPVNVGKMKIEATPIGAMYQVMSYAYGVHEANKMHKAVEAGKPGAHEMSADKMAEYTRNLGRAVVTSGMVFAGAVLNALGAIKNLDREENEDLRKMYASKGLTGLQFNLTSCFRLGDHEWREGDIIVGGAWLELLATPLSIGAMAWESREDSNLAFAMVSSTWKSFADLFEAAADIPGLQQAAQFYEGYTNATVSEDTNNEMGERLASAFTQHFASSAGLYFLPNIYSAAGAGLDNTVRDTYNADGNLERALKIIAGRTAIARRYLPEKKDSFGETRTYGSNKFMGFLNKVVLPGDFIRYSFGKTQSEVMRLLKDGYTGIAPATSSPRKITVGDKTFELNAEQRSQYRDTRAKTTSAYYDEAMSSKYWADMSDAQRAKVLNSLRLTAERETKEAVLSAIDPSVEVTFDKWQKALTSTDLRVQYLLSKQRASEMFDGDGTLISAKDMDDYLKNDYSKLNGLQTDLLDNAYPYLDDMYKASAVGITSEQWVQAHDIYKKYTEGEKKNQVATAAMWAEMSKIPGMSGNKLEYIEQNMRLYNMAPVNVDKLNELNSIGLNPDKVAGVSKAISELPILEGHSGVLNNQKYEAIAKLSGYSDEEKWKIFLTYATDAAIRDVRAKWNQREARGWSFAQCLHEAKRDVYK